MAKVPPSELFTVAARGARPLSIVLESVAASERAKLPANAQQWLDAISASNSAGNLWIWPGEGGLGGAALIVKTRSNPFSYGDLSDRLPPGTYALNSNLTPEEKRALCLGFGLGAYRFDRYKKDKRKSRTLLWPEGVVKQEILSLLTASYWARDLINTPASDMGPSALAREALTFARAQEAKARATVGDALLTENYPMIHAVGRASNDAPRLVDFSWGKTTLPKLTLVGKGVCFDTGGLDLKPGQHMKLMKKDMGGAALILALASYVIERKLPVRLRVLLPIVENSVSGNAMRPLDVLASRKGLSVEVGDTDAEGRLILADALTEAGSEEPDLVIDAATLTGAARVALGTAMPVVFASQDSTWRAIEQAAAESFEPVWRLPLYEPYRKKLESKIADYSNIGDSYGGAITAALFLEEFVRPAADWVHIDTMAYNLEATPGRPAGGEAQALLTWAHFLEQRYRVAGAPNREGAKPTKLAKPAKKAVRQGKLS